MVAGVAAVLAAFGVAGATLGFGVAAAASGLGVASAGAGVEVGGAAVAGWPAVFSAAAGSAGTSPLIEALAQIAGNVSLSI